MTEYAYQVYSFDNLLSFMNFKSVSSLYVNILFTISVIQNVLDNNFDCYLNKYFVPMDNSLFKCWFLNSSQLYTTVIYIESKIKVLPLILTLYLICCSFLTSVTSLLWCNLIYFCIIWCTSRCINEQILFRHLLLKGSSDIVQ